MDRNKFEIEIAPRFGGVLTVKFEAVSDTPMLLAKAISRAIETPVEERMVPMGAVCEPGTLGMTDRSMTQGP